MKLKNYIILQNFSYNFKYLFLLRKFNIYLKDLLAFNATKLPMQSMKITNIFLLFLFGDINN